MTDTLFGKIPSWDERFEEIWARGIFRKLGKLEARRRLRTSVKTETDWADLQRAHEIYKADLVRFPRHRLHGSTFASQWRDFLELSQDDQRDHSSPTAESQDSRTREAGDRLRARLSAQGGRRLPGGTE